MKTLLALMLFAAVSAMPLLKESQKVGSQSGLCPDGSEIVIDIYDPKPEDPAVGYWFAYKRQGRVLGVLDTNLGLLHVPRVGAIPLEEARQRWGGPCDLPDPGVDA